MNQKDMKCEELNPVEYLTADEFWESEEMKEISTSYDEGLLLPGNNYTVGTNDGREFRRITFVGYKQLNGKPMMLFSTEDNRQLTVNPSFHAYTVEEESSVNAVTYEQAMTSGSWK